jgi:hypothetical protein
VTDATVVTIYLGCVVLGALGGHAYASHRRMRHELVIASYFAPALIAAVTTYVFVVRGGTNIVQGAIGSVEGYETWSRWGDVWAPLLGLTLLHTGACSVWLLSAALIRSIRRWTVIAGIGSALAALGILILFGTGPRA